MIPRPHVALDGHYSITEAAILLGKSRRTLYRWCPQDIINENGLFQTKTGAALVHDGYFVMLKDLVERLPRILRE